MTSRLRSSESTFVFVAIAVLSLAIGIRNSAYFGLPHQFSIARSMIVVGIMALGLLMVLVTGGIDVSVTASAVSAMYVSVKILVWLDYNGSILFAFVLGAAIGAILGLINGLLVSLLRLPPLIVTLGTLTAYRGFLLFFVGTERVSSLPAQMKQFSKWTIVSVETSNGGKASLHGAVLVLLGLAVVVSVILRWTPFGRAMYAIGGDAEAAQRLGIPVTHILLGVYAMAGALAGIAGIVDASLIRAADPFTLVGSELDVLAAVVIGGASIAGGRGTVSGTILGVILIALVDSSLVLVGIPTNWRRFLVGIFILIGVSLPSLRNWSVRNDPRKIEQ